MVPSMSTIQIFSRLVKLVFPLTGFMICAILMGVAGFLCAIFIPVLSSMALVKDSLFSFHTIVILFICVCTLKRNHCAMQNRLAIIILRLNYSLWIRDQVFGALRKLCPAKLEVKDKGSLISLITSDIELLEVFMHIPFLLFVLRLSQASFVLLFKCNMAGSMESIRF